MTSGGVSCGGGGAFGFGMSSFTACVMTGSVMMSVTSSTSITSMSGVVLMSQKVAPEAPPTGIDMELSSSSNDSAVTAHAVVGLGEEADLQNAAALDGVHDPADVLVAGVRVAANVNLRLRLLDGRRLDQSEQLVTVRHPAIVPVNVAFLVHRDGDVLGLGLGRDIDGFRQLHGHRLGDHRDSDQKDD